MANTKTMVKNTNGKNLVVMIDWTKSLSIIRNELENRSIMSSEDCFLDGTDAALLKIDEETTILSEFMDSGSSILIVGKVSGSGTKADVEIEDYRDLNESQKQKLFSDCQIFNGLTFNKNKGVKKSTKAMFTWSALPDTVIQGENTVEQSSYSFSEITRDLNLITSNKTSLAIDTPYVSAEAEYKYEKKNSSSSKNVTEHLLAKYMVLKLDCEINPANLKVNPEFVVKINEAITSGRSDKDNACYLLHVLNEWGLYIPLKFTLGGALYSTEKTEISEFSKSEQEKTDFSASFKASFSSISGSAGHSQSKESTSKETSSTKYTNITINQIGGIPGKTKDKEGLAKSLNLARYWQIVDVEEFYPSLMFLKKHNVADCPKNLLATCIRLLNDNYHLEAVANLQPFINMGEYATAIETLLNPFK